MYRSQLTGRISAFEDRTERSLNLTGGKWHFGIDKAYWLNAVRPFPVHPSIAEQSLEEIIAGVRRNVVQVQVVTESGEKRLGSGFVLDSGGKIVTNYHVVQNAVAIRVAFPSRQGVVPPQPAVGVLHANPDEDLVVLQSHMPPMHHYPGLGLGWGLPEVGATVGSVSMAMGMDRISGTGTVNAVRLGEKLEEVVEVHDRKGFWIQTTTPFSPGADGSSLFDKTGAVIGVMTFTLERGQNLNFAVSIESLRNVKYPVHLFQIKAISPNNLPTSVRAYGL